MRKKIHSQLIETLLKANKDTTFTIYKVGDFIDLCRGPHLKDTEFLAAFKFIRSAGIGENENKKKETNQFQTKARIPPQKRP